VGRAIVAERFAAQDPAEFVDLLEPVIDGARRGVAADRSAMVAVASFIAHELATGGDRRLAAVGEAATTTEHPLTRALFTGEPARSLARGGKLADVGISLHTWFWPIPFRRSPEMSVEDFHSCRAWWATPRMSYIRGRPELPRARSHHDPGFIARLLDARWTDKRDVVTIAARRPIVPAMSLAVATRDRWFRLVEVREALAENPFTPSPLGRVLRVLRTSHSRAVGEIAKDEMR
jgi:hypothetical protein